MRMVRNLVPTFVGWVKFGECRGAICVRVCVCVCVCVCEGACRFGGGPGWSLLEKLVAVGEGTQECGSSEVIR